MNHKTKLSPRDITIAITILSVVVLNACSVPGQTPVSAKFTMPAAASATRDPGQPALRSYSLHMVYTYESKDAKGAAKKGGIELTQEIIVATRDQHVTSRSSGSATSAASTVSYETFLVDGISYLFNPFETGDQKCVRLATRQPAYDNPLLFKPAEIFASLKSPKPIKQGDDIDGIMADQYSVNENDFTQGLFTSAIGNIWVAQDGRYVVKYAVEGIGPSMFSTSSALDKITWAYKLSDINQVTTLSLPTECNSATAAEDIPAPDDAANKNNEGPLFTYGTGLTPAKIGEYYRTTLKAQGWTESSSTLDTLYTFTKEGRTLSIFTTKQTNGYHVIVTDTNVR